MRKRVISLQHQGGAWDVQRYCCDPCPHTLPCSPSRSVTLQPHTHTHTMSDWKKKCQSEWDLQDASMPDGVDWKRVYESKALGRNLLKNTAPYGMTSLLAHMMFIYFYLLLFYLF